MGGEGGAKWRLLVSYGSLSIHPFDELSQLQQAKQQSLAAYVLYIVG
jgi:hypothetical protein